MIKNVAAFLWRKNNAKINWKIFDEKKMREEEGRRGN